MNFVSARRRKIFSGFPGIALVIVGVLIGGGVLGCAPAVMVEEEVSPPTVVVGAARPQAPTREKLAQPPSPIKETTLEEQAFRVQELSVREDRGQTFIHLKFSAPVHQYRHFSLIQPSRVVLDIFGESRRAARVENYRVETHWLGLMRLSSGDGYLRLVMEIASAAVPPYVIEPQNDGLKITIGPVNPALTSKKEIPIVRGGKRLDVYVAEAPAAVPNKARKEAEGPEAALAPEKKYTGQRISLDFKDADIKNVFRLLAEVSGLNIVVTGDVARVPRVTLRLVDVPWDQALDLLIETNGLGKEQVGNVVRISTAAQLRAERDALAAAKKARENLEPLETAYLSVNYAKVKDLMEKVRPALSTRGKIVADDRSNTLIVYDIRKGIDEATAIVSRLDTRTPQVLIESNLIETTPSFARALGFQLGFDAPWHNNPVATVDDGTVTGRSVRVNIPFAAGAPAAGLDPFFSVIQDRVGSFRNIQAILTAAEQEGNVKIISRPSVVTLNNVGSTIQSLRIIRITLPQSTNIASGTGAAAGAAVATERVNVGIVLTVTPQVSADGFVLMSISVKSSSIAANVLGGTVVPFDELSREAIANVLVRDGETIVIGGIMKDSATTSESGIPFLKDIPIFGWFFKNIRWQKDFEELMVFITPRIITGGSENLPTAEQLWRQEMKKTEGNKPYMIHPHAPQP